MDGDYEAALDLNVADIKQSTLDGGADHILATRFLKHFVNDMPWLHVDLSASRCEGWSGYSGKRSDGNWRSLGRTDGAELAHTIDQAHSNSSLVE